MNFTFLGTGGAFRIPRAGCNCKVCNEARTKGFPYKRLGQSLFLHDKVILFDTPEDILEELNAHNIKEVKHIFYSHWHPDHTFGCRVIEVLREGHKKLTPIYVYMPEDDIKIVINERNSVFKYFESMGYCKVFTIDEKVSFNSIRISRIKLLNKFASAFLIESKGKRVIFSPCQSMYLPLNPEFKNVDLLIMCLGSMNYIEDDVTHFERDNLRIIKSLEPKSIIFTHIEEDNGLSYDDYKNVEKKYKNITFAYDGMNINI